MLFFWMWTTKHPFMGFSIMLLGTWLVPQLSANVISRCLRAAMVITRGWPKNPALDADGDWHGPEREIITGDFIDKVRVAPPRFNR